MTTEERRNHILEQLTKSDRPLSASSLASVYNVSRQIIVGDIALLRAQGTDITSTPRGYILEHADETSLIRTIVCKHDTSQTEIELNTCIDYGCKVLNVIVDHPLYGQLTGELQLSSRYDIRQFMDKLKTGEIHSLCELTDDFHIHTLKCPDEDAFEHVCSDLTELGILIDK